MRNPNIRPASREGNVVTIASDSVMTFCNERGAKHYMEQRATAAKNREHEVKTLTFEAPVDKKIIG